MEAKEARYGLNKELKSNVPNVPAESGSLQTHLSSRRSVSGKMMLGPAPRVPQEILRPSARQRLRSERRFDNFMFVFYLDHIVVCFMIHRM